MTVEQRLNVVETDLETVKQLLVSAASYAESANRGLDRLTARFDELGTAQAQTQLQIDQLTTAQTQTQTQLNQLSERVDQFIFHSQRLITQHAGRLEVLEGQTERLEAIVKLLNRNYEAQQSQMREFQVTTNAALERIDRVLDYLLRESGGSGT